MTDCNNPAPQIDRTIPALKSRLMVRARLDGPDATVTLDAKRDLSASVLEKHIREVVARAPRFTASQRARLAALLDVEGGDNRSEVTR